MFPSLTQSLDRRSQSTPVPLGPIPNGLCCRTRQAGVSPIISHLLLSEEGGRERPELALMANLFLPVQVGQEGPAKEN